MSISVSNLCVTYPGGTHAVSDATFTVRPGEVVALLGGNGAGKSSTLRVLAGVAPPTSGTVMIGGFDLSVPGGADSARSVLGYCPDMGGLPRALSVRECIGLALAAHGDSSLWPSAYALAATFDLTRVLDRPVGTFSHGMGRRTSALLALLTARDVLLLDEPFDGVDAAGVELITRAVGVAASRGLAVVVSTHLLDVAAHLADRAVVMTGGRVVADLPARKLRGRFGASRYAKLTAVAAVVPA